MTAQIELNKVEKHYGAFHALKSIDLTIPKGQFVALVGPSGCGKSTLLRTIAGLEGISDGHIAIAGKDVSHMPPRKRDLAMVFQSYALYPHMTVAENLAYSLRIKGVNKKERRKKAEEIARITGLEELLDRLPRQLSGGQRQRVAMGRAVIREPEAFLFDEPLSNLDAALRVNMRAEVRKLHDRLGATSVYVTHDQVEAMTMADHVVVLRGGVIEQQGAPLELYDRPVNRFVAGFIGSPAMNFIEGTIEADGKSVKLALPGDPIIAFEGTRPAGEKVEVGMRPEHLLPGGSGSSLTIPVSLVERTGALSYVVSDTDPPVTVSSTDRMEGIERQQLTVAIEPKRVHLFARESGEALLR
ncbi:ABC transporter ATP-binding protein [Pelagovum pacificum]|uniref:sn-glycerol-3-phosphate ABC transporter ATP-binding protein UgpC n=1 Tax=Pelagovum pacificum TaxID=2588711 RepID=A0A5C5GHY5_9RHOB|nr:sn-glycerol-3-phosphate ABC transporter ATP-binding protein UgpC [Pelagovum pacificum]QQA43814.1 sn-glycerol-3-phosphate ABC transporter ATP-binding protein UgpC [Pelagovum pacificum]TNY33056.1 sn-glycerol-3-phosphate ABC transporter ATP-binding protein UgpC [Pelagovum pacificum]